MRIEKTKHSDRRGAALALAAVLLLAAAAPAAAGPLQGRGDGLRAAAPPLVKVWEGVWGWLTAVWGEQGNAIDPDGAKSPSGEQGNAIDPDGTASPAGEQDQSARSLAPPCLFRTSRLVQE